MLPSPSCTEREWYLLDHALPLTPETWSAILALVRRPYFERLWILQEVQTVNKNSTVQCGQTQFPWYNVRRAFMRCFHDLGHVAQLSRLDLSKKLALAEELSNDLTLFSPKILFDITRMRECSDPRDKVFGVLALLPESWRKVIKPRYDSSVKDVYIEALLRTIDVTQRLGLLDCAAQGDIQDQPSWVPNFSQAIVERYRASDYSMAACLTAAQAVYRSPDQLQMIGIIHGCVIAAIPDITASAKADYLNTHELISEYFLHMSEEEYLEVFLWVITMSDLRERWYRQSPVPTLHEAKGLRQLLVGKIPVVSAEYRTWFYRTLNDQQPGRFFITDGELLGCDASGLESGDKIAVLLGYDSLVNLRHVEPDTDPIQYQHVVSAYVHGLMEGQTILGPLPLRECPLNKPSLFNANVTSPPGHLASTTSTPSPDR